MNWATAIPLVTLLGVVFMAGVAWAKLSSIEKAVGDVRADMKQSAKDQGTRIGDVETDVGSLKDWRTAQVAAQKERRRIDTRGIPIQEDDHE